MVTALDAVMIAHPTTVPHDALEVPKWIVALFDTAPAEGVAQLLADLTRA